MKYISILYLCSMATGKCPDSQVSGFTFKSHYDCVQAGYRIASATYKELIKDDYYGLERINEEKIAIKFECKELDTKKPGTPS